MWTFSTYLMNYLAYAIAHIIYTNSHVWFNKNTKKQILKQPTPASLLHHLSPDEHDHDNADKDGLVHSDYHVTSVDAQLITIDGLTYNYNWIKWWM